MRSAFWLAGLAALLVLAGGAPAGAALTPEQVNKAQFERKKGKGISAAVLRAQVLLDRLRFSPGAIDGVGGENFRKALAAFQRERGLQESGRLDEATWQKLIEGNADPALVDYAIKPADVKGPFTKKIPPKMEQMAKLPRLGYRNALELLAERFHMDEKLLKALNPGKRFDRAGETIVVANVARDEEKLRAAKVEVDKNRKVVRALDKDGKLLAIFPASIGSEEKPAPSGSLQVRAIAQNPTYRYNPNYKFKGVKSDKPFVIKPGPNNPVGVVWIDLSEKSYGIHGTPEPTKVSKTFSHGCVRLTNWDARDLSRMVAKGTPVEFLD